MGRRMAAILLVLGVGGGLLGACGSSNQYGAYGFGSGYPNDGYSGGAYSGGTNYDNRYGPTRNPYREAAVPRVRQ
jgi:hypothetical protein